MFLASLLETVVMREGGPAKAKRKQTTRRLTVLPGKPAKTRSKKSRSKILHNQSVSKDAFPDAGKIKRTKDQMPGFIEPMQATRIEEPFNNPDFIYEVKFDGY